MIINSKPGDRVFVSWSGGKDAYLALLYAVKKDLKPVCLLNFTGSDGKGRSHGLKAEVLRYQADALGVDLLTEAVTWGSYEKGFTRAVSKLKEKYGVTGGVFGDINLVEHRAWLEEISRRLEFDLNLPLWQMAEQAVLREFMKIGAKTLLVAVKTDLVSESWLGEALDQSYIDYCLKNKLSPCGERGEAHSFVVDGPLFKEPLSYKKGPVYRSEKYSFIEISIPG